MTRPPITLVGDGIENPWNARTLLAAAAMFGSPCLFRDRKHLTSGWATELPDAPALDLIEPPTLANAFRPIVALDNLDRARSIYGFRLPPGDCPALLIGNERFGLAADLQALASAAVEIPMVSRRLNCLNVAAAATIGLYYLSLGTARGQPASASPQKRRPELLLLGATDHVELGSTIRSAGAFGWRRILVDDRHRVWFGVDRARQAEGRAAARRQRNPIALVPVSPQAQFQFDRVTVVTTRADARPLQAADLARGSRQLLVIADEHALDIEVPNFAGYGANVELVRPELPLVEFPYHYRLIASIALAESARQIGARVPGKRVVAATRWPTYERALRTLLAAAETLDLRDLEGY